MSQHIFEQSINDRRYEIIMGWDKPLQCYYGVILGWIEDDEFEEGGYFNDVIWSGMRRPNDLSLETMALTITNHGFTLPDGFLDHIKQDRQRNAVNETTHYDPQPPRYSENHTPDDTPPQP